MNPENVKLFFVKSFCRNLRWRLGEGEGHATSIFELAVLAFHQKIHFSVESPDIASPASFAKVFVTAFRFARIGGIPVAPVFIEYGNKSNGRAEGARKPPWLLSFVSARAAPFKGCLLAALLYLRGEVKCLSFERTWLRIHLKVQAVPPLNLVFKVVLSIYPRR